MRKKITKNDTTMAFLSIEDTAGSIEVLVFPKKYEQFADLLVEDTVVLLTGKLSLRDDEVPKLLLEEVASVDGMKDDEDMIRNYRLPPMEFKPLQRSQTNPDEPDLPAPPPPVQSAPAASYDKDYGYAPPADYDAPPPSDYDELPPPPVAPAPVKPKPVMRALPKPQRKKPAVAVTENNAKKGLFLRVASRDGEVLNKVKSLCGIFEEEGTLPVVFYYADEKKYDFESGLRTEWNEPLAYCLAALLGEKNVAARL